ncbi:MAG: DTW domain-containing protein [Deltaproteobacteria bacterium]|nr:DTW domain-containing protein [Deltaproteobacteria bacterium]
MITRQSCYHCNRPLFACICSTVPLVHNQTPIYLLQHPRERFHPLGSVRLVRLGLSQIHIDIYGKDFAHQRTWSHQTPSGAMLLYPGPKARELESLATHERPQSLVVIDGTWSQAKSIIKKTEFLATMPQISVRPKMPGLYRIRREPALHCMSTIEAIIAALQILEPKTEGLAQLLAAFTAMIEHHIDLRQQRPYAPFRRIRLSPPKPFGIDKTTRAQINSSVIIYGEFIRTAVETNLLYWTAWRLRDHATFAAYINSTQYLDDFILHRMRISKDKIVSGISLTELQQKFAKFLTPNDIIAAWNKSILNIWKQYFSDTNRPSLLLKSIYCNQQHKSCGKLHDISARHNIAPEQTPFAGRAADYMGYTVAITKALAKNSITF